MSKNIQVTKCQPRATREDFLVRGIGKRAIRVIVMNRCDDMELMSKILSEYELYWLLVATAEKANKRGWKVVTVKIYFHNYPASHANVYLSNCSGFEFPIGRLGTIVEIEHFLNDPYYVPKGFYIK